MYVASYIATCIIRRQSKHRVPILAFLQMPKTSTFATSRPPRTAPTSPSLGTLWMATTPPATSVPFVCITRAEVILVRCTSITAPMHQCPSLTAQHLAAVPPSATPGRWRPLTMNPTSCGCGCTDLHWNPSILIQRRSM